MRPILLLASLSTVFASPTLLAQSELESLRARCAEQERQIAQLEQENLRLRTPTASALPPSEPSEASIDATAPAATYTVKSGDSLEKIARKTGTSVAKLINWNRLKSNSIIKPGQSLKIAEAGATASTAPKTASAPSSESGKTYQVQNGDTFSSIARNQNISVASLIAANPSVKPSALRIGQTIRLDSGEAAPTSPTPTAQAESSTEAAAPMATSPKSTAADFLPDVTQTDTTTQEPLATSQDPASTTEDQKFRTVTIDAELTYGEFATKHGTDIERLNALNGLDLTTTTVLAKGSELYIPAQP